MGLLSAPSTTTIRLKRPAALFPNAINRDGHLSMGNINRLPSKLKTGGRRHGSQMSVSKMKHISRSCLERDAQRRRARYCSPPPHRTAVSKERARERVVSVTSRSLAQPLESDVSLMTRSAKFNWRHTRAQPSLFQLRSSYLVQCIGNV